MNSGGTGASCMGLVDSRGDPCQAVSAVQRFWLGAGGRHEGIFRKSPMPSFGQVSVRSEFHAPLDSRCLY